MMITFYINQLNKPHELGRLILSLSGDIYIHCNNQEHANQISEALWSYPDRFIPNQVSDKTISHIITIGYTTIPKVEHIINASNQKLELPHIEWVSKDLASARERYKAYKALGYELDTHTIN